MNTREVLINLRGNRSQESISKELGITQKHLSAIERGKRNPSIKVMQRFEKVYQKPMTELFPDIFLNINTTQRGKEQTKSA